MRVIVSPRALRLARLGGAYLNGQLTRQEYEALFDLEVWLLKSEGRP